MLLIEIVDQVVKTNVFHLISTAYINYDDGFYEVCFVDVICE